MLEATEEMCYFCFDTLLRELTLASSSSSSRSSSSRNHHYTDDGLTFSESPSTHYRECPLFVTWDAKSDDDCISMDSSSSSYSLRGCIGTLSPRPVASAMRELALSAALTDRRFQPVELRELPRLRVGVSLLVQYEDCAHCFDWEVGVHGIIIKFDHHYNATYLPDVASEQMWNQVETVNSLIRKAGYNGPISENMYQRVTCTRYQSSKKKVTYEEYIAVKHNGDDPISLF